MGATTITPAPIRKTFEVAATPEKAFRVFTEGLDRWWPRQFQIGRAPLARAVLEPRTGGRWYEVGEDGGECEWGEVLAWDPPRRLVLAWRITSAFAFDPAAHSEIEVLFTPLSSGVTQVDFEHRGLEGLGDGEAVRERLDSGWPGIIEGFKATAETPDGDAP